jgi:hypothetical protein
MTVRPLSITAILIAVLFAFPSAASADDKAKEKLAYELMALTGAADLGEQMIEGMVSQFRTQAEMPTEFLDKFVELADGEALVQMVVPLYVKNFDEETLQAAVDFYKTPSGKKLIAGLPQITQESMVLCQKWGVELPTTTTSTTKRASPMIAA